MDFLQGLYEVRSNCISSSFLSLFKRKKLGCKGKEKMTLFVFFLKELFANFWSQVLKRIQMSKNVTGVMVMNQDGMPVILILILFVTLTITFTSSHPHLNVTLTITLSPPSPSAWECIVVRAGWGVGEPSGPPPARQRHPHDGEWARGRGACDVCVWEMCERCVCTCVREISEQRVSDVCLRCVRDGCVSKMCEGRMCACEGEMCGD